MEYENQTNSRNGKAYIKYTSKCKVCPITDINIFSETILRAFTFIKNIKFGEIATFTWPVTAGSGLRPLFIAKNCRLESPNLP